MSKLVQPDTVPADERCDHPISELGKIARDAYCQSVLRSDEVRIVFDDVASAVRLAVIEECARVAKTVLDQEFGLPPESGLEHRTVSAILALKASPPDEVVIASNSPAKADC